MRVLVTGAEGFIGKNLTTHLCEHGHDVVPFIRGMRIGGLAPIIADLDFIFHLAGTSRTDDTDRFQKDNTLLTKELCDLLVEKGARTPLLFTSSIQAARDSAYGTSKLAAEEILGEYQNQSNNPVYIYRLPNVFGKWSKPNYNSVVATFCFRLINDLPIDIFDGPKDLHLSYIDDVIAEFFTLFYECPPGLLRPNITTSYHISVEGLARQLSRFREGRTGLVIDPAGAGLVRALYSTYLSFLEPSQFSYPIASHTDGRGRFVEMFKTDAVGQLSFFTVVPGATRGGHYHHSKAEKFLVVQGKAHFKFCHILTRERAELIVDATTPQIVDTIPGWSHDITNVGECELISILWANEVFDRERPDTITHDV